MPEPKPSGANRTTKRLAFDCPAPLADAVTQEASNRGVTVEELLSSLVVTPLSDILSELHLSRFDQ